LDPSPGITLGRHRIRGPVSIGHSADGRSSYASFLGLEFAPRNTCGERETLLNQAMDPLHATMEEFAADGYTQIAAVCMVNHPLTNAAIRL
jgi:hypothetical protein